MSSCNLCGTCSSSSSNYCGNSWLRCVRCGRCSHEDYFRKTLNWPNAICEYCYTNNDDDMENCDFCDDLMKSKKLVKSFEGNMCHRCIIKNKKIISFTIENSNKISEILYDKN